MNELRFRSDGRRALERFLQQGPGVPLLARASVDGHDFHSQTSKDDIDQPSLTIMRAGKEHCPPRLRYGSLFPPTMSVVLHERADSLVRTVKELRVLDRYLDGAGRTERRATTAGAAHLADSGFAPHDFDRPDVAVLRAFAATLTVIRDLDGDGVESGKDRIQVSRGGVPVEARDAATLAAEADGQQPRPVFYAEDEVVDPDLADDGHQPIGNRLPDVLLRLIHADLSAQGGVGIES